MIQDQLVAAGLSPEQTRQVLTWLPGVTMIADLSWGLVDTTVLRLRRPEGGPDVVVKAGGPVNHHLGREIDAHTQWLRPWVGKCPVLRYAQRDLNLLVTEFLPGHLVEGSPAEDDPETYRQAGALLRRLHDQTSRLDEHADARAVAKSVDWLDRPHRIPRAQEDAVRVRLAAYRHRPRRLVPTHGDWQPRNWLNHEGTVHPIDFGRAAWRTRASDWVRLAAQQFRGRPELEATHIEGYGADPREAETWPILQLQEAIGTAVWAHQVGDQAFEAQGLRMLREGLGDP